MGQTFQVTGGEVTLDLPAKTDPPSSAGARAIREALTSVTTNHPQALTTYTYYEVVDLWLGPWAEAGYPIAYGKYYNVLFNSDRTLMANPQTRAWVEETTVKLEQALTDFVVEKYEAGRLGSLGEAELRAAAFASHAKAYTDGGLAKVVLLDPLMIPVIATIPSKEFDPSARDFGATVMQVFETLGRVVPTGAAVGIASLMPAHSGFLQRAAQEDARRYRDMMTVGQRLGSIQTAIVAGHVDHVPWLDQIISELNRTRFDDAGAARFAREVVQAAEARKRMLQAKYSQMLKGAPREVRVKMQQRFPGVVGGAAAQP
jgi:hypothetical protein